MQLTCSPVYSISLFTFNFSQPLPESAYTWTTPDYRGLENRPREDIATVLVESHDFHLRVPSLFISAKHGSKVVIADIKGNVHLCMRNQ